MDIIVCVKQVPDTETQIKINSDGTGIVTDDIKWVMNPYDEFGVEEALRLKEKFGGSVTVVSVGPKKVTETIRTALAMGADKGVMVADDAALNGDGYSTAKVLAGIIKGLPCDLVFCGQRAVDDDCGVVGATLAEMLGVPNVSLVTKLEFDDGGSSFTAARPVEGATIEDPVRASRADHLPEGSERAPLRLFARNHESQEKTFGREDAGRRRR